MQIHKLIIIAPFFFLNHSLPSHAIKPVVKPVKPAVVAPTPAPVVPPPPPEPVAPPPAPAPPPPPPAPVSFPVASIGTYANTYAFGNCTWYVAGRKNIPNTWGNAADWSYNATAQGITVSSTPLIGAIAQRTGGLGHVAIVEDISGDQVLITEMNSVGFDVVDERWMPISTYNYIYT